MLSQYCSVAEIQEWGKPISGIEAFHLEKDVADDADYPQTIAP